MRTLAAIVLALVAVGARAQTAEPTKPPVPAPDAAAPAAPAAKEEPKPKLTFVIGEKSQISLSGRAWAEYHNVRATAGTAPNAVAVDPRWRVQNNSSYLRIRGERGFEDGWKLIAQIEAEFGIDGEEGTPFSGTRNTGVGVSSPYGTLIVGRWDSPTKQTTIGLDPFVGTGIFGYYNVFGQQQTSPTGQGANRWDRRLTNSINYWSPSVAGFTVIAAYAVGETTTGPTPNALPVAPWVASGAVHYKNGPLFLGASYELRNDCGNPDANPGSPSCNAAALGSAAQPNGRDQAIRVGAGYTLKGTHTKLAAAFERIGLTAEATATLASKTLTRTAYWGSITQGLFSPRHELILNGGFSPSVGGHDVWVSGGLTDNADTGGSYWTGAYRYWIDKDTDVYLAATQVRNMARASYRFGSGNIGNVPVGSNSAGYGVGLRYMF